MRHLLAKDKKYRTRFYKLEMFNRVLNTIVRSQNLRPSIKINVFTDLSSYKISQRIRGRSFISGRVRSIICPFSLSRIDFRLFALSGNLGGIRKSSW